MHILQRARRFATSSYGIRLVILLGLLGMPGWLSTANAEADGVATVRTVEDPWRRTPNGWELVNRWNRSAAVSPTSAGLSLRLDSHPAVLALVQSLAIVAAFALFPPRHSFR